ncbi:EVE domain protein [compost metagenome]
MVRVARTAYTDPTQFDQESPYFDAKSPPDNPRWQAVDMLFERKLARLISLDRLKTLPGLENLPLVQRGSRLSVMPVGEEEWRIILGERQ